MTGSGCRKCPCVDSWVRVWRLNGTNALSMVLQGSFPEPERLKLSKAADNKSWEINPHQTLMLNWQIVIFTKVVTLHWLDYVRKTKNHSVQPKILKEYDWKIIKEYSMWSSLPLFLINPWDTRAELHDIFLSTIYSIYVTGESSTNRVSPKVQIFKITWE